MPKPEYKKKFLELGIIEKVGRGRGSKYMLSHNYYESAKKAGIHTRITGLSREEKKSLILKHIERNKKGKFKDFSDAFQELKRSDMSNLLMELKKEEKIRHIGARKSGYWELSGNKG